MLIGLADEQHATETLTAYVFAIAALQGTTPRVILARMLSAVPEDETWTLSALPELMEGVYDST